VIHPMTKCRWCGEAITEAELTANGCDSCGETLDPYPEPDLAPYMLPSGQHSYPCPTCGDEAKVYHDTPDNAAWCERCGLFDVNEDGEYDYDGRAMDRSTLSPRIPRRSIA
jgi:endogenous inhibitor of DNA gyrase (YacG/DUF329 family)